ncbi:MAG TPA: queuosine precursor transporter [Thermomicrobiales bacterium]|nr:queuosine precursor transporter [Thermomicrobiales bacterium]
MEETAVKPTSPATSDHTHQQLPRTNAAVNPAALGSPYFLVIVALYVTCLIMANILAVKILHIGPWVADAGTMTFPVAYIVGDILTEVYGYSIARRVIWLGFICNLLAVGMIQIAGAMPADSSWDGGDAYNRIFGSTPRILFASACAYIVGEFVNSYVLARMKIWTNGRFLWTRTIGSTIVGEGLDSVIFVTVAFAGTMSGGLVWQMVYTNWILKTVYETIFTPVTYLVINKLKQIEGVDKFDRGTNFNPLAVGSVS